MDAHTKWIEVCETSSTSSLTTIENLRRIFSIFGLPKILVSDNGTCFTSQEFSEFIERNCISHITTPPYNPASNGAAENCVKVIKGALTKALSIDSMSTTNQILCRFLLDYRNTPHCTTGLSPANLIFGRSLRTKFDIINPNAKAEIVDKHHIVDKVARNNIKQKNYYKGKKNVSYTLGEVVLVRDYRNRPNISWIKGIVHKRIGKCTYFIEVPELKLTWKRHANQIRKTFQMETFTSDIISNSENSSIEGICNQNISNTNTSSENTDENNNRQNNCSSETQANTISVLRPKRAIKPVERYGVDSKFSHK
ncbi:uncharacterized protein K02A2.6-like [Coccinella septempunctata]|uniref:uncharacterized protein K02A2.6-like n=1 Tax=Coccinella septempunctata TaxID=41139 RepID=UPI001D08AE01|nr:uncharacterized protein K02A2.6-like [Coccinella septempunctata]